MSDEEMLEFFMTHTTSEQIRLATLFRQERCDLWIDAKPQPDLDLLKPGDEKTPTVEGAIADDEQRHPKDFAYAMLAIAGRG